MALDIWVNTCSGDGLLPDGTQSHYLNPCCPIIDRVVWHWPDNNFTWSGQDINSSTIYRYQWCCVQNIRDKSPINQVSNVTPMIRQICWQPLLSYYSGTFTLQSNHNNSLEGRVPIDLQMNRPVSQIQAPSGGLSRTSGKLWQDYSNCYMFWT